MFYFQWLITIILTFLILRTSVKIADKGKEKYKRKTSWGTYTIQDDEIFEDFSYSHFTIISIILVGIPFLNLVYAVIIYLFSLNVLIKSKPKTEDRNIVKKIFLIKTKE